MSNSITKEVTVMTINVLSILLIFFPPLVLHKSHVGFLHDTPFYKYFLFSTNNSH